MPAEVFALDRVTAARPGAAFAFRDFSWNVREGETWAVVGPTASGKSTLLDLVAGKLVRRAGDFRWPLLKRLQDAGHPAKYPSDLVHRVAFAEESRLFSYGGHYYQQRFNFVEKDEDLILGDYLRAGLTNADAEVRAVADRLGVGGLLGLSFLKLSNGQTRRARLARALLARPQLLLLDDPTVGLDAAGRAELDAILSELVAGGVRLIVASRPGELPGCVTDVLTLPPLHFGEGGRGGEVAFTSPPPAPLSKVERGEPILELDAVTVRYGDAPVLDAVSWAVRPGERWAVLGPNGSGKTTLLALICGDHPQAYRNRVRLFGRQRGTGESIWEVKRNIGLLTPELHLYFREPLTALEAVNTGWRDVVVDSAVTPEQRAAGAELLAKLGLADAADRPFARLSTGQQRLALLARALVKRPPLVVLDEPFQALDAATANHCRRLLDAELRPDQALLFVTHLEGEIPASVRKVLRLDRGRAAAADFVPQAAAHQLS